MATSSFRAHTPALGGAGLSLTLLLVWRDDLSFFGVPSLPLVIRQLHMTEHCKNMLDDVRCD